MNIRELLERRGSLALGLRSLLDQAESEKRALNTAEEKRWEAGLVELDGVNARIARDLGSQADILGGLQRGDRRAFLNAVELRAEESLAPRASRQDVDAYAVGQPAGGIRFLTSDGREVRGLRPDESFAAAMRGTGSAPETRLSMGRFVRALVKNDWRDAEAERRAMITDVDTQGGFGVPRPLGDEIIDLSRANSVLIGAGALTIPMESKTMTLVRIVTDPTVVWKQEDAKGSLDTAMQLGAINYVARMLIALVPVSLELVMDAPNVADAIDRSITAALGAELDRVGLFGLGQKGGPPGLYGDPDVGEVSMETNGAALTDYAPFVDAIQKVLEGNGHAISAVYSPRTAGALGKLVDTLTQPLRMPELVAALKHRSSTRIPNDLVWGTADDASAAFVGDFSQVAYGVRNEITLEVSREAGESFERARVLVRAYLRADVNTLRPAHLCRICGIIPAA